MALADTDRLSISLLTREYPPSIYGGAGVHVAQLVPQLRKLIDVDVQCMGEPREGATAHAENYPEGANAALRVFGADLLTMFTVDYEIGGAAQAHDHPFEETYVFLAGEVSAELDGTPYTFRPGDVVFAGVGSTHGFWNEGTERVRWIETQAPQPPVRHAYRWGPAWKRFEEENDAR